MVALSAWEMKTDGMVMVAKPLPCMTTRPTSPGTLLTTITPIAPAACAFFTLTDEAAGAAIDERDLAGHRGRVGESAGSRR